METSKYDNQAIRDQDGYHVDIYKRHGTMIMSADSRESGQAFWSNEVLQDQILETDVRTGVEGERMDRKRLSSDGSREALLGH